MRRMRLLASMALAAFLWHGCALRTGGLGGTAKQEGSTNFPEAYARAMAHIVQEGSTQALEDSLRQAYSLLEDLVGADRADQIVEKDAVFNNEFALVAVRKGEFDQARDYLQRAWGSLQQEWPGTAPGPFRTGSFDVEDRLYDTAAMDARRDQAVLRGFRDFVFLQKRSERDFVDRIMRRTHRFPPQPSLFPGSFATVPIEIVNDWHYQARQADLLTWQRFGHLPVQYGSRQVRLTRQGLAINQLILGTLKGDGELVDQSLQRLEQNMLSAGRFGAQNAESVLMFGYFVLGNEEGLQRYEDPALKAILTP